MLQNILIEIMRAVVSFTLLEEVMNCFDDHISHRVAY